MFIGCLSPSMIEILFYFVSACFNSWYAGMAFTHQYRFAAAESVEKDKAT